MDKKIIEINTHKYYSWTQTNLVGTQKHCSNERILLSANKLFKLMDTKQKSKFNTKKYSLTIQTLL